MYNARCTLYYGLRPSFKLIHPSINPQREDNYRLPFYWCWWCATDDDGDICWIRPTIDHVISREITSIIVENFIKKKILVMKEREKDKDGE